MALRLALGICAVQRQVRYLALFEQAMQQEETAAMRISQKRPIALASGLFQQQIEATLKRSVGAG